MKFPFLLPPRLRHGWQDINAMAHRARLALAHPEIALLTEIVTSLFLAPPHRLPDGPSQNTNHSSAMSLQARLRILHRQLSPWVLPLLLLSAITGLIYRIGRAWFSMSKETGEKILHLHVGEWLGEHGSVIYVLITGSALLFLIFSGLWMWFTSKNSKAPVRKFHRALAVAFALPLILSAITGIAYQIGSTWFDFGEDRLKLLLSLHQGSWLGPDLRPFYILFLAAGLIALCLTGFRMLLRPKA